MALSDGQIPLKTKDLHGRRATNLELLWDTWCSNYSRRKKFSTRLAALWKMVEDKIQPNGFKGDGIIWWPTGFSSKTSAMNLSRTIWILKRYTSWDQSMPLLTIGSFKKGLNHSGKALENCWAEQRRMRRALKRLCWNIWYPCLATKAMYNGKAQMRRRNNSKLI